MFGFLVKVRAWGLVIKIGRNLEDVLKVGRNELFYDLIWLMHCVVVWQMEGQETMQGPITGTKIISCVCVVSGSAPFFRARKSYVQIQIYKLCCRQIKQLLKLRKTACDDAQYFHTVEHNMEMCWEDNLSKGDAMQRDPQSRDQQSAHEWVTQRWETKDVWESSQRKLVVLNTEWTLCKL